MPISVVVPTVCRPVELARCVDALLAADVVPAEIVVVDQGGDEETALVLSARRRDDVAVVHLRSPLRGLSAARNAGLRQVSSPWVAFTDDDCVPDHGWIAAIHRRTRGPDAPDGVSGRVLPFGEASPETHTLSLRVSERPAVFRGRALPWAVGTGGNMAVKAALLRDIGGYDERLGAGTPGAAGEDLELIHRLLRAGSLLAFDPSAVVYHARVSSGRRMATRRSYGFGMGAFVGVWAHEDWWMATASARWLGLRVVGVGRALRHADRWRLKEEALLVVGLAHGVRFGWQLGPPLRAGTDVMPGDPGDRR